MACSWNTLSGHMYEMLQVEKYEGNNIARKGFDDENKHDLSIRDFGGVCGEVALNSQAHDSKLMSRVGTILQLPNLPILQS